MTNPNDKAFAPGEHPQVGDGLTKREYYAGLAMQPCLNLVVGKTPHEALQLAAKCADDMIAILNIGEKA